MTMYGSYAWQKMMGAADVLRGTGGDVQSRLRSAWMELAILREPGYFPSETLWREFKNLRDEANTMRDPTTGIFECTDERAEAHAAKILDLWERVNRLFKGQW